MALELGGVRLSVLKSYTPLSCSILQPSPSVLSQAEHALVQTGQLCLARQLKGARPSAQKFNHITDRGNLSLWRVRRSHSGERIEH